MTDLSSRSHDIIICVSCSIIHELFCIVAVHVTDLVNFLLCHIRGSQDKPGVLKVYDLPFFVTQLGKEPKIFTMLLL